jgi:rSAM/selenodomain-associated transferase 1
LFVPGSVNLSCVWLLAKQIVEERPTRLPESSQNKLIVFVKAPRPGTVKTRLAQSIGSKAACAAYCEMVQKLIQELSPLKGVQLRFSPDDAREEIRHWQAADWDLQPQGEGDLGQRLRGAFEQAFAGGARYVLVIGSDCPAITIEDIRAAWDALDTSDLVLGPARDGGYWLIGLTRACCKSAGVRPSPGAAPLEGRTAPE